MPTPAVNTQVGPFKVFRVEPGQVASGKKSTYLLREKLLSFSFQVVADGGENNLHAHRGNDAIWFVLSGQAKFYGEGDQLIATLDANDGLYIPRETAYWYESSSPTNLVILRVGGQAENVPAGRIDLAERKRPRYEEVAEQVSEPQAPA